MSKTMSCNFCTLKRIKDGRLRGEVVRVILSKSELGGFNIYLLLVGEKLKHEEHFIAWMMEIPSECAC